jgi:hypothetical protein
MGPLISNTDIGGYRLHYGAASGVLYEYRRSWATLPSALISGLVVGDTYFRRRHRLRHREDWKAPPRMKCRLFLRTLPPDPSEPSEPPPPEETTAFASTCRSGATTSGQSSPPIRKRPRQPPIPTRHPAEDFPPSQWCSTTQPLAGSSYPAEHCAPRLHDIANDRRAESNRSVVDRRKNLSLVRRI